MTTFLIAAALLVAGALLFVLPPLLRSRAGSGRVSHDGANISVYRDQLKELEADLAAGEITEDKYRVSREEIEGRVLDDVGGDRAANAAGMRWLAPVLGVLIPASAAGLYLLLGNPDGLDPQRIAAAGGAGLTQAHQIQEMVDKLAAKLKENPDDVQGWNMLARSYAVLERFPESVAAYREAVKRAPGNAALLADFADTLGMAQGRRLQGEPEAMVLEALKADPKNLKALALLGTAQFDRKDYLQAAKTWEKMLSAVPPGSEAATSVLDSITEARRLAGLPPPDRMKTQAAAPAGAAITGKVALAPEWVSRASASDVVFIFARAAEGPRMPLAVQRKTVRDLPTEFRLDDSMAMAPGMTISSVPKVVVGARISKTGNAMPQQGDLEALSAPVAPGASVNLVIGAQPNTQAAAPAGAAITGKVALAPEWVSRASANDVVFIFARAAQGPRMPLAIQRKTVKDLPTEFRLDDSMAMAPGMTISSVPKVVVGARISKTGNAMPQKGDLEALSAPVSPGTTVNLVIGTQVN